jgi:hypothetical protein
MKRAEGHDLHASASPVTPFRAWVKHTVRGARTTHCPDTYSLYEETHLLIRSWFRFASDDPYKTVT